LLRPCAHLLSDTAAALTSLYQLSVGGFQAAYFEGCPYLSGPIRIVCAFNTLQRLGVSEAELIVASRRINNIGTIDVGHKLFSALDNLLGESRGKPQGNETE
jgi:hypothetical protein